MSEEFETLFVHGEITITFKFTKFLPSNKYKLQVCNLLIKSFPYVQYLAPYSLIGPRVINEKFISNHYDGIAVCKRI